MNRALGGCHSGPKLGGCRRAHGPWKLRNSAGKRFRWGSNSGPSEHNESHFSHVNRPGLVPAVSEVAKTFNLKVMCPPELGGCRGAHGPRKLRDSANESHLSASIESGFPLCNCLKRRARSIESTPVRRLARGSQHI